MHDLLLTSTSCHFKTYLESDYLDNGWARPYCGVLGVHFYSTPLQKMERGIVIQQPNVLDRSSRIQRSFSHQPSSDFRPVRPYRLRHLLCPDRGHDVKTAKDDSLGLNTHELMHALINIVEQFHKQGVRRVVFGSLFLRHHSVYNKRCDRLNECMTTHRQTTGRHDNSATAIFH